MLVPISWLKDYVDIDVKPEVLAKNSSQSVLKWKKSYIKKNKRPTS